MKWSNYSYFFKVENTSLVYNSLSNSFAELTEDLYSYLANKKNIGDTNIDDIDIVEGLKKLKILVEDEKDELNELKYIAHIKRFNTKKLSFTINPTLHCNFACVYCFEKNRVPIYMTDEVEDLIIDHIRKQKDAESLNITWFGGEPFMAFDRIVSLTKKVKELNLKYTAGIITNGYLLTEKKINQLLDLNIRRMQITLDGMEQTHNQRRCLVSKQGTFKRIINNIKLLKQIDPEISLSIRVNLDEDNKDEFIEIYNFFKEKNLPRTRVTPAFVDDPYSNGETTNSCMFDRKRKVDYLIKLQKEYNIDIPLFYPDDIRYECGTRNPNIFTIGPKGEIYKCWNDVGNDEKIVGSLDKSIKTNNRLLLRYLTGADPFDDDECRSCFYLPICGGGCPYSRLKNLYEGCKFDTCTYIKDNLEEFLTIHYKNKTKV